VIGISAASHGRRGSPVDLLTGSALQLRDIFRQTNVDQMALVRMIEAGVDVDGDGTPDLDAGRIGYLGISLGGLTGGPFVAAEARVRAAVLNVTRAGARRSTRSTRERGRSSPHLANCGSPRRQPEFDAYCAREVDLGQHGANRLTRSTCAAVDPPAVPAGYAAPRPVQEGSATELSSTCSARSW
jgi:hypothetical protein